MRSSNGLGGVSARPQATTARVKHCMQDVATDLGVELPLTRQQHTAFMKERRAKVEDEGAGDSPPSPCAPQDDRDPCPTPRRPRPPSLPVPAMSLPHERGVPQLVGEVIVAQGAGTIPQALRTLHVACAGSVRSWAAVAAVAPEADCITPCTTCSIRLGPLHSSGITVMNLRLAGPVISQWPSTCRCSSCFDAEVSCVTRQIQWFGWRRVTFMSAHAEVQKSHDIDTHTQKRTKMDTCEEGKRDHHFKRKTTNSFLFGKHDGFCHFPCRPSKNGRSEPLGTLWTPRWPGCGGRGRGRGRGSEREIGGEGGRTPLMLLHMSASTVHVHQQNSVAPHVCFHCTRTSTEHPEHIHHSSCVSSLVTSTIVAHVEFLSFVARQLPEKGSRVTPRHDLRVTNVSVTCGAFEVLRLTLYIFHLLVQSPRDVQRCESWEYLPLELRLRTVEAIHFFEVIIL